MKNIYDYGDKADNYVFFDSSDVKSADAITYDDNDNVIPLSERFNNDNPDIRYSIRTITGISGKDYGKGVYLDSTFLDNLSNDERKELIKEYVKALEGEVFTAFDNNGNKYDVTIADSRKFKNKKGKRVSASKDLKNKYIGNVIKQESISLIDELILTSKIQSTTKSNYSHGWLDNNGLNNWDKLRVYVVDKNYEIWEVILHIANAKTGEKILYDITPTKNVERSVNSDTGPHNVNISSSNPNVNINSNQNGDSDHSRRTSTEKRRCRYRHKCHF